MSKFKIEDLTRGQLEKCFEAFVDYIYGNLAKQNKTHSDWQKEIGQFDPEVQEILWRKYEDDFHSENNEKTPEMVTIEHERNVYKKAFECVMNYIDGHSKYNNDGSIRLNLILSATELEDDEVGTDAFALIERFVDDSEYVPMAKEIQ